MKPIISDYGPRLNLEENVNPSPREDFKREKGMMMMTEDSMIR